MKNINDWISIMSDEIQKKSGRSKEHDVDIAIIKMYISKYVYNEPAMMSYAFNGNMHGLYLSHKGCARASDAVLYYPNAIRSHQMPKRLKAYELYNEKELPEPLLEKCNEYLKLYKVKKRF